MRIPKVLLSAALICIAAGAEVAARVQAQDVIFRRNGTLQAGRIVTMDDSVLRLEVELIPGQPPAQLTIPRQDLEKVVFAEREDEAELLAESRRRLGDVIRTWRTKEPFLRIENSNAGAFGLAYANALIESNSEEDWLEGYNLFLRIEEEDWNPSRNALAKQGKLRAMIRLGRAEEAVEEALALAEASEDPEVLIEATYVLAENAFREFIELLENNPRWEEDLFVRPERHRLYNEALDRLLFPYLFHGTEAPQATRGLWRAIQLYQAADEYENAAQLANDIIELYPDAAERPDAEALLAQLTEAQSPESKTTHEDN